MLQAYCSKLEHRVVERFDAAVEAGDEEEQGQCVRIMIQCDKERTIAQVGTPHTLHTNHCNHLDAQTQCTHTFHTST
jgi:hypothetical protein